ncbi:MAG: hypothetical protein COT14_00280 [Candidatus Diapherotrites archaeon CG08_land_8_20_14_0_20_30_16]|nr:MAG: hypothetical protein COT14_00280 [Candidatus Diapherotrites archaeon CG08_land_8_20_14_0_20_30_16]
MVKDREIEKLVDILKPQAKKYSQKQIKSAILSEGYDEDTVQAVLDILYPVENKKPNTSKEEARTERRKQEIGETRQSQKQETTVQQAVQQKPTGDENTQKEEYKDKDYYKEVNYLLGQLKEINKTKITPLKELELTNTQFAQTTKTNSLSATNLQDLNTQIEKRRQELNSIKIEPDDDSKIILSDGKIINLNDYQRRDWRNYRDKGKTLAETKEEQIQKLRQEIYALKRQAGREKEVTQEENISKKISERVRQRSHGRIPEKQLDIASKNAAENLREKYKTEEIERKDLDTAADNIYIQMTKNPNIYGDEEKKEEKEKDKKVENKNNEKKKESDELSDLNISTDFNLDSGSEIKDIGEEFNLGLDLNLNEDENKQKDKKKK